MANNIILPKPHRILSIDKHTETEYTFRVAADEFPDYGQFFMLSLPKIGEAPISASGRGDGYVEFTIRNTGVVTKAIFDLIPGNIIFLRGPYGNSFPVDQFENKDFAVICGGTGMAPVLTMLDHFYENPDICKSVHFIVGFKNHESVLFKEKIAAFRERFHTITCLDNEEYPGFNKGFVTQYVKEIPIADFGDDYNLVIVGPPAMMNFTAKECLANGAKEENIWVSFERKMSCGVGKCGHCKINDTYVCLDGPVFNYKDAKGRLID